MSYSAGRQSIHKPIFQTNKDTTPNQLSSFAKHIQGKTTFDWTLAIIFVLSYNSFIVVRPVT